MTRPEKYALLKLLEIADPPVALEIGTYKGGSLQAIASFAKKVYTVDLDSSAAKSLRSKYSNVEFLVGNSAYIVPQLLESIELCGEQLGFVLIDGDHSESAVRKDINSILYYTPKRPIYILCHDSFHPVCRRGIIDASWQESPHVHYVELDFIPGVFHAEAFDTAKVRSMYGGFALALMLPEERSNADLTIYRAQQGLFEIAYRASRYWGQERLVDLLKSNYHKVRENLFDRGRRAK